MFPRLRLRSAYKEPPPASEAAHAYDALSSDRAAPAGGASLFDFAGADAFACRETWARLDAELVRLRTSGRHAIRILDAGCGRGEWLLRLAIRARDLGFSAIEGRGFDMSRNMIALAEASKAAADDPHVGIQFDVADIDTALDDEDDGSFDIVLSLHGMLNHLSAERRTAAAAALARVTDGSAFIAVRTAGSPPALYVTDVERARSFHQNNEADRLEIDLVDGRHIGFSSHLFTASELQALFAAHLETAELVGLDLFHKRFAPDPRWNPGNVSAETLKGGLERLEHLCSHDPLFLDHAAHVLLHARSKTMAGA